MSTPIHELPGTESSDSSPNQEHHSPQAQKTKPAGSTLSWIITLFGTAVGAGILFLPLNAGSFGFGHWFLPRYSSSRWYIFPTAPMPA